MKCEKLRQMASWTLSAGMLLSMPAVLPEFVPQALVAQAEAAETQGVKWEFKDGLDGWKYGGKWDYKGEPVVEASSEHGGAVRLGVNFAEDKASGWSEVKLECGAVPLAYFMISIVGSNTDYTGDLFLGHLHVHHEQVADGYVDVQAKTQPQAPVVLSAQDVSASVPLVDAHATQKTAQTYAALRAIAATDHVVYGHQNEMHRKVSTLSGHSDTYDMVQDDAGIVGVDGLALTGDELELTDAERAAGETYSSKLTRLVLPAVKERTRLLLVQD